ncbi:MAG: helix-turn-helix domain-containing protein [Caldilineaceae bacterium]
MEKFGQKLRHLRKQRGYTLRELAPMLGIHYTQLNNIEHGTRQPSGDLVLKAVEIFGVSADQLIKDNVDIVTGKTEHARLDTQALVIGYAMSRLDLDYLAERHCAAWSQAYEEASKALTRPPQTFKNLRDEFDPFHANSRRGWHQRPIRMDRQKVMEELAEVSKDALLELIDRILKREDDVTAEAIDSLAPVNRVAHNVAERLLTGRLAEEFFLSNAYALLQVEPTNLLDLRQAACGYDFGVRTQPEWAIEVKGLKQTKGSIQFTDREWSEARIRQENYWLIVVGNIASEPLPRIIRNPHSQLSAHSTYRQSIVIEWHSTVSVNLQGRVDAP